MLLALGLRLVFFTGTSTSDDLNYIQYAHQVTEGTFHVGIDHFSFRLGIIYPTALFFTIFGASEFTGNLIVLLLSLAGIVLLFLIGREIFGAPVGITAALLLAIFPLDVFYATRLLPEIPSAFFMALTVFFFLRGEKQGEWKWYALSGLSFGIAYLIKETSLLLLLFFGAYALYRKRFSFKYALVGLGLALGILTILVVSFADTGDPFFQRHSNAQQEIPFLKENYPNYFTPEGRLIRLFAYVPYTLITSRHLGFFFPLIFAAAIFLIIRRKKEGAVPLLWCGSLLAYMTFGTISLHEFVPFPLEVRHFIFITYPSLLLLAAFLHENQVARWRNPLILALLAISLTTLSALNHQNTASSIKEAHKYLSQAEQKPIYSDQRTAQALDYLFGFERSASIIPFQNYDPLAPSPDKRNVHVLPLEDVGNAYVVVNEGLISSLRKMYADMKFPDEIDAISPEWKTEKAITSPQGNLTIYSVG